jgi:poly(A) polymerase Pap1
MTNVVSLIIRELVLGRVAGLVKKFVHRVCVQRGLSEAAAAAAGGKIFTFGSYRLGVHGPGSDIDTLFVVPKHVAREDFFLIFEPMLREFEGVSEVSVRVADEFLAWRISCPIPVVLSRVSVCREYRRRMCPSSGPRYRASR